MYEPLTLEEALNKNDKLVLTCGMGVNSTAIICKLITLNIKPDLLIFADTGGEWPETYQYLSYLNNYLFTKGWPQITTVKYQTKDGEYLDLYDWCINNETLPSKAFGFPSCSVKHKVNPQNKYMNKFFAETFKAGKKVTKIIGIDSGEDHRIQNFINSESDAVKAMHKKYDTVFPLVDWDMDRDDCVNFIRDYGLNLPKKSACYFCPSSKKHEIRELERTHPDLCEKALFMEQNAIDGGRMTATKGLARQYAWKDILAQRDLFDSANIGNAEPCVICYDG